MNIEQLLQYYALNSSQIMWFLGAGASRSAGMPSATDIIWDLKRLYYCRKENQDISDNELSNEAIKQKIQIYLEAEGAPGIGSEEEYSFYFKFVLGESTQEHQNYLQEKLNPKNISINSGHRVLSALIAMGLSKLIFTTNFDNVLETAFAQIAEKELHAFSLEGSNAALNALNNEQFPIYAKMHGDFRYCEMKNLPEHLIENDKQIETCFVNACSRYGLIVAGYSGRDRNVISAFNLAIEQRNAFPKGLFWITSINGTVFPVVQELISKAQKRGINAHLIPSDTFDALLGRIWKLLPNKPVLYDSKIRRAVYEIPKIQRYDSNGEYPIIRTNAFPILQLPQICKSIETVNPLDYSTYREKVKNAKSAAITSKQQTILVWGSDTEIEKIFSVSEIKSQVNLNLDTHFANYESNSHFNSFLNWALARALVRDKPLVLRKRNGRFYAVVSSNHERFSEIEMILKEALKSWDFNTKKEVSASSLAGRIPNLDCYWMEAAELSIDYYDGKFWLIIRPEIWVEPDIKRKAAKDFLTAKKKNRYNITQNRMIEAWKKILLGDTDVSVKTFSDEVDNNPEFKICVTTAFSQRQKNG